MKKYYLLSLILVLTGYSCVDDPEISSGIINGKAPSVETKSPQDIHLYQATLNGNVVSNNGYVTSSRGFYISLYEDSLSEKSLNNLSLLPIVCGSGQGTYSGVAKNLQNGTKYYYRAFAKNDDGTSYGLIMSFETTGRVWEEMPAFPGQTRVGAATFVIGNKLYITCGSTSTPESLGDTWEFNITESSWIPLSDFPGEKRRSATAFTIAQKAYVGTGQYRSTIYFNDFYAFGKDTWEPNSIVNNDISSRKQAMSFGLNGKGYLVGGSTPDNNLNEVWQFIPNEGSNNWTRMKDFPIKISEGIGIYGENRAFVGFGVPNPDKMIWEYNDTEDSWQALTMGPANMGVIYAGAILNGNIYVSDEENRIWELNLSTKEWKFKSKMPSIFNNYKGQQCMFAAGDYLYIGLNNYCKYFYKYNPALDK